MYIYNSLIIAIILIIIKEEWIAFCVLGCILVKAREIDAFKNTIIIPIIVSLLVLYLINNYEESTMIYVIYSICALSLLYLAKYNKYFSKLMNNKYLSFFGKYTMSMLLTHVILYEKIIEYFNFGVSNYSFFIMMLIWLIVLIPVSFLCNGLISLLTKIANYIFDVVYNFFISKIKMLRNIY